MEYPIVEVHNLSHRYSAQWAIRNINFSISQKGILGLLGSNGAGKSTTMNIICGVLNQTCGQVYINGIDMQKKPIEAKKQIGFLPQKPPLQMDLTVDEYLAHCADLRLMPKVTIPQAIAYAKERCGIAHFSKRVIKNLSGGYQQRVGIAQAILHKPKFVVLDEPTNGLDPNQIVEVRALIKEIAKDHSVMLSTHILSEVQAICDQIRMIENGCIVFAGTMEEFNNYIVPNTFSVTFANPPATDVVMNILPSITHIEKVTDNTFRMQFESDEKITEKVVKASVANEWNLSEIMLERCSLDTVFAQLSGKLKQPLRNSDHHETDS